jgi:hypothetical protein
LPYFKKYFTFLSGSLSLCFLFYTNLKAQSGAQKVSDPVSDFGYINKGDSVEFVFGQQQTITIGKVEILLEKRINDIKQVNIAGDFNGWSPDLVRYQMRKAEGKLFTITLCKASLGKTGDLKQFKFVLNHTYWVEPPTQAINKFTGKDGNTNLTLKL